MNAVPLWAGRVWSYRNHILRGTNTDMVQFRSSQMGFHVFCFGWVRCSISAKENRLDLGQIT